MLVTFRTKAYANITMFGDVAVRLLNMMGHSGTVPSAIRAEDVPAALQRLRSAVAAEGAGPASEAGPDDDDNDNDDESPKVPLTTRAVPLIELLEAAADRQCDVMWDS